ncbi:MAG: hypothetical protein QOH68_4208 [Nocardioidaceae bacterium]|nr:hypothetical protein [Nocardioidaceae bacterium]
MPARFIAVASAISVGIGGVLFGAPASAEVQPAVLSATVSPTNVTIDSPTTRHINVSVVLSAPADAYGLDAIAIDPVTLMSEDIRFKNPSGDGLTWIGDIQTSRYDWYYGTYGIGNFEVDWWEGVKYESTYHSNEAISSPPLGYTIKGATRLSISKSRNLKRGKALAVRGNLTRFDSVGFDGFAKGTAVLQQRRPGKPWNRLTSRIASQYENGALAVSVKPKSTTYYRWVFAETRDSVAATSKAMKVTVVR